MSLESFISCLAGALLVCACSRNPATQELEAFVPEEPEEIALGQEADLQLRESVDLYEDSEKLSLLVSRVGSRVVATTERSELPWQFAIVDDPTPNAFALPGGPIYVTRGLLAHLNSEAELAAVLAHESGHVSARHGVRRMQRAARQQHRLGHSSIERQLPNVEAMGSRAVSRLFEREREEELVADDLGLRYLERANYEPMAMAVVLDTLGELHGGPGLEEATTHPTTLHRRARIHSALKRKPEERLEDPQYLEALDGMLFGPDPREGYFKNGQFVHPNMGFSLDLPEHWTVEYRSGRAVAKNPESNTYLVVSQSRAESVRAGMNEVFSAAVAKKNPWSGKVGGRSASMAEFSTVIEDRELYAFIGFIEFDGKIIQVVAFSTVAQWPAKETRDVFKSFKAASVAQKSVDPMRVELVEVSRSMTLETFYDRYPSSVPLSVIARINHVEPDEELEPGTRLKRVRGFNPDFSSVR